MEKLEDDLFFADLTKQISLLIMDDEEDPIATYPSVSLQVYTSFAVLFIFFFFYIVDTVATCGRSSYSCEVISETSFLSLHTLCLFLTFGMNKPSDVQKKKKSVR